MQSFFLFDTRRKYTPALLKKNHCFLVLFGPTKIHNYMFNPHIKLKAR